VQPAAAAQKAKEPILQTRVSAKLAPRPSPAQALSSSRLPSASAKLPSSNISAEPALTSGSSSDEKPVSVSPVKASAKSSRNKAMAKSEPKGPAWAPQLRVAIATVAQAETSELDEVYTAEEWAAWEAEQEAEQQAERARAEEKNRHMAKPTIAPSAKQVECRDDEEWDEDEEEEEDEVEEEPEQAQAHAEGGEDQERFLNTCGRCGETWLLVIEFGEEFMCEEAGGSCGHAASKLAAASFSFVEPDAEDPEAASSAEEAASAPTQRTLLLRRVIAEGLTTFAAADAFLSQGMDAPRPAELEKVRDDMRQRRAERTAADKRDAQRQADAPKRKTQMRYLDGKQVEVKGNSKYLVEAKESTEDRLKTSCNLVIIGSHSKPERNGPVKRGPRS